MPITKCACCNRELCYDKEKLDPLFCSTECAVMSGRFSIKDGPINQDKPIKQYPPKRSWWMTDEIYEEWIASLGWKYNKEKQIYELGV